MTDIVERLLNRSYAEGIHAGGKNSILLKEAADEIERLRDKYKELQAEVKRLEEKIEWSDDGLFY